MSLKAVVTTTAKVQGWAQPSKAVACYSTAIPQTETEKRSLSTVQAIDRIAVATGDMFVDWLTFFENTVERFRNPVDGRVSVPYGTEFSLSGINLVVME